MNQARRIFLKNTLAGSLLTVAAGAGLLSPRLVLAAWPEKAFEARSIDDAVKALVGSSDATDSTDVKVKAPDIAENGSVVPITVESSLAGIEAINVMVLENARPLAVSYNMTDGVAGYVATRIKMGKTSDVIAIVKAGGKLHRATKAVKVTLGGCGG
jgi:sulfur-oxidizing protein SoxY